ncbi:hypothetical protein FB451DRAFT_1175481 [Mycena latifolia]|nr:hypothetical protein FB451DRAFT_1175481 [Mycena latifolia]
MTEDYTPSIHIEPPPDSEEQTLFASLGMFDNNSYCSSSQSDPSMNFAAADRCYPQVPALFIQGSESPNLSSELSPLEDLYLQTDSYRYSPSTSGRSSPIEATWSPASSYSGDIFPDDFSHEEFAPHWAPQRLSVSGQSSPALSPSLSPLTSAFDGFALDESYPSVDQSVLASGPPIQRLRSSSHSVQSASPADIWTDGVGRGRSASFSAPTTDNQFYRNDLSAPQGNFPQYGYSDNGEVQISVANVDSFPNSLGTGMSWGSTPTNLDGRCNGAPASDNGSPTAPGNLVTGWRYPSAERPSADSHSDRPPPSPSHLTVPAVGLVRRGACASRRSRSQSDLSSLMPDEVGRGRGQHRSAQSMQQHSRSVSNGSRAASPHGPVQFSAVQTPASYSPRAPSSPAFEDADLGDDDARGVTIGRRRTFTAIRGPDEQLLSAPTPSLTRASSAPSKGRRSKAMPSPATTGLGVFKAERTETSSFLSSPGSDGSSSPGGLQQEFRVSQPPDASSSFKPNVASKKIRQASDARRTNAAPFQCPLPSCPSTFTARHNLINHINSHNKHRPHRCLCGFLLALGNLVSIVTSHTTGINVMKEKIGLLQTSPRPETKCATVPLAPHPELLFSDTVPSDSEAAVIRAAIDTTQKKILSIEEEMERLGRALNECSARRRELREFGDKQRSALSLFRRLPHEVVAEVFLRCQENKESGRDLRCDPRWIIAQVCGRWRAVALSTPSLWADIEIHPWSQGYVVSERSLVFLLSLQIERSGQTPLSLRYMASSTFSADTRRSIFDLFLSVAHRWQEVDLNLQNREFQRLGDVAGGFPLITKLKISSEDGFFDLQIGRAFLACPRLQHLLLPLCPRPLLNFPWKQLKTCVLQWSVPDVLMILQQTSHIDSVTLYHGSHIPSHTPSPATTSETLRSLTMSSYDTLDSGNLLAALTAPALERLTIDSCHDPCPHITGFLARSRCPLTHLTLRHIQLDAAMLLAALELTSALTYLVAEAEALTVSAPFVDTLARASLVPHLASLALTGFFTCENAPLIEMLRARVHPHGALRVLRLVAASGSPLSPCVDELRDEGLDVSYLGGGALDPEAAISVGW